MSIKWNDSLAVGVDDIDSQHMELFSQVDKLLQAMAQGKGRDEIGKVLDFIGKYVATHFATEEKYMAKYNYPNTAIHKIQHEKFVDKFTKMKQGFDAQSASSAVVMDVKSELGDWLVKHIGQMDKQLGNYLATKMDEKAA